MKNVLDQSSTTRRKFLMRCGKFAAVTPPTLLTLLSLSDQSYATAVSGGGKRGGSGRHEGSGHHGGHSGRSHGGSKKNKGPKKKFFGDEFDRLLGHRR